LIYDKMTRLLMQVEYQQCDETYFQVNKDGREAGTKSYMWVHITSELAKEHPIIVYCFELTRGTDHLRKFYEDFKGYITCDAYISYHVLGEENTDVIIICGCMMHLRRRFVKSLSLINTKRLDYDTVEALPETKVLKLIGRIYDEDEPLKALSAEERKEMREQRVRPLINELYEYIDSFDVTDPLISDRLRDAIQYARNQKKYIYKFLNDGNIPIDGGATERAIRPFTIGRNNWIACDSIVGAETSAIMYTIVETAKANKVNVYHYLKYLLEQVPKHLDGKSLDFLDDMLPWSDKYLSYEKIQTMRIPKLVLKDNEYDTRPQTPRKSGGGDPRKLILAQDTATA
jgi:transposase